ncbi:MAG: DNA polymerase Y family protein [Patescibacteria group bacterium]
MNKIIFHIDGDAFFASCEQSTRLDLRGRAIAVGRERGVATAFSYEAKAMGITRGMSATEIARDFPSVLFISSDYRKYGLFSTRMNCITRKYTELIEQTSIDECYADMSAVVVDTEKAKEIALKLQNELSVKLGLTFSIGIGPNKTIAKIASSMNKPRGITLLFPDTFETNLYNLSIDKVSGIGPQSAIKFHTKNIYTIGQFVGCNAVWVYEHFAKPFVELHRELRGHFIRELELLPTIPKSISKIRAFSPATSSQDILYSEFVRNAEIVASKLSHLKLEAKLVVFSMKCVDGTRSKQEVRAEYPITSSSDIVVHLKHIFNQLYDKDKQYRSTSVAVYKLGPFGAQQSLFTNSRSERYTRERIGDLLAGLTNRFGKGAVSSASSMVAQARTIPTSGRNSTPTSQRGTPLITNKENGRALYLPYLGRI